MKITEINITPIKPFGGQVAFASIVIDGSFYLSSIAIYVRMDGSLRLLYPTKKIGEHSTTIFHPIRWEISKMVEQEIFEKYNELLEKSRL